MEVTNIAKDTRETAVITADSVVWGHQGTEVFIDGVALTPHRSQALKNHSPKGFAWGYNGSGPAQLALAMLLAAGATERQAIDLYQDYQSEVIARLTDHQGFVLLGHDIIKWLNTATHLVGATR